MDTHVRGNGARRLREQVAGAVGPRATTVDARNMANPHDALFKDIFKRPEHVRAELQSILPRSFALALDWTTLVPVPGDHRDAGMAEYYTDLLFSVRMPDRGETLYLVFEHQSTQDRYMAFRLLNYMVRVWDRGINEDEPARRLPLIVPVLVYHGGRPWWGPLNFESLVTIPSGMGSVVREFIPCFRYLVDDLSRVSDEELRRRALPIVVLLAAVSLRDLRHKRLVETFRP